MGLGNPFFFWSVTGSRSSTKTDEDLTPIDPPQKRARPRRLIDTHTIQLVEFPVDNEVPPYAILSHRWVEGQEISYQEMLQIPTDATHPSRIKTGFQKIVKACKQAVKENHAYIWADTCCIHHGNYGQVSQDINSMFDYYKNSEICFVYLHDLHERDVRFIRTEWFTRGWTLQELIAPSLVKFFNKEWGCLSDKRDLRDSRNIYRRTMIPIQILRGERSIEDVDLKERMSWSLTRKTTKEEDQAYCLLGLLGVTMETNYGEGVEMAFQRLSRVLCERYPDQMKGNFRVGSGRTIINILLRRLTWRRMLNTGIIVKESGNLETRVQRRDWEQLREEKRRRQALKRNDRKLK
ncbi:hypothetical protein K435DRAFT_432655 [Dendrothele bispora CBS 962.96]|uniref:Heterokaryon incompatibility domain-containing protein n=1 Tax=Dendrothele bispora (strain CBS 962.96) TaxID=1314807 RepID=A0A4S8L4A4_DENBC|nr:hypothetical protein K435DRAFT_432655 [Dendrothele bispora CBS 962.96]